MGNRVAEQGGLRSPAVARVLVTRQLPDGGLDPLVAAGHELVQREGDDILDDVNLKIGESYRVTPGTIHQMIARTDCDVLEVSTPEIDDVVRLSDRYGREGTSEP